MTNCLMKSEEHAERLLAFCAGRLGPEASNQLRQHMEACPDCRALGNSQVAVWSALDSLEAPPVSADFNRRLYARIEASEAMPWYRRWFDEIRRELVGPLLARPTLPLAAAAAVVVAGFLLDHPTRIVTPTNPTISAQRAAVSVSDVEQVERTLDDLEMLRQFDVSSDQDKEKTSNSM